MGWQCCQVNHRKSPCNMWGSSIERKKGAKACETAWCWTLSCKNALFIVTSKERREKLCKVSLMWPSSGCGSVTGPLMSPPHQADPTGGGISPLLFKMQFSLLSTLSGVFESSGIFYYVWKSTLVIMWAGSPWCALAFSLLSDGKCCCDIPPAAHKCEIASEGLQGWRSPPLSSALCPDNTSSVTKRTRHVTLLDDPLLLGQVGIGERRSNQTPSAKLLFRYRTVALVSALQDGDSSRGPLLFQQTQTGKER